MTGDARPQIRSLDPSPGGDARPRAPWLLVVARGYAPLVTELRTMFRDDPRVQVIENRREDHALLPRSATVTRVGFPAG